MSRSERPESGHDTLRSIGVHSETHDAEEISRALGLEPSSVTRKGDPISRRNPAAGVREEHGWFLDSPLPDSARWEEQAEWALDTIEQRIEAFRTSTREGASFRVNGGIGTRDSMVSLTWTAKRAARIARLDIDVWMTIDPTGEQDEDAAPPLA